MLTWPADRQYSPCGEPWSASASQLTVRQCSSQVDATCSYYFQVAPEEAFELSPLSEKQAARFLEYTQRRCARVPTFCCARLRSQTVNTCM